MKVLFALLSILVCSVSLCAQDITGFWKTVNEKTHKPESVIAIYEYQGKCYGRIIATYDNGIMTENLYAPKKRAPGVFGNPYYCGLDIIWDLHKVGSKYKGRILDPEKGNIYHAELWVNEGKLVVRGKILFLGRNQVWPPVTPQDFPKGFKMPDPKTFTPIIPEV